MNAKLVEDPQGFEKVASMVMLMLRWRKFNESRWATLGPACRSLLCASCIGLSELVAVARASHTTSNYYLHGFDRLNEACKLYACVAAAAAYPVEAFSTHIMCDDRLCRTLPEVQAVVVEELCYVENLADAFWERLSNIVGAATSSDLRSLAVHVAHTAVAFTYRHVLQVAVDYPYKLAYGDVGANLDALHRCPDPVADPTTMQIRALLESGYNRSSLVDAVLLFREIPWSTQAVEQSHGSTACIHRLHEGYGADAIATRAMLHQARRLLLPPPTSNADAKSQIAIQSLKSRIPMRVTAHNLLFNEVMAKIKERVGGAALASSSASVLHESHNIFASLSLDELRSWHGVATHHTDERRRRLREDFEHAVAADTLKRARDAEEAKQVGLLNHSGSCRFTDHDFAAMVEHCAQASSHVPTCERAGNMH